MGGLTSPVLCSDCSDSAGNHNRTCSEGITLVPARKKPTDKAVAPATGRKKTAARKPAATKKAVSIAVSRVATPKKPAVKKGAYDLVIVESPAKAKTINKYLGSNYRVLASYGHIRDLPKRRRKGEVVAGIDIDGGWVPTYVVTEREESKPGRRTAKDILAELKREAA